MSDDDDQVLGEDYEVQKVLYHDVVWVLKKEGTMDKRRDLKPNQVVFRVRWVGYGPGDDTWEPAEHVQHTTVFEEYCQKHGIHGEDRLTCEGRVHKVNADGLKSVKKKSVTKDPPPKKVKTKRGSLEDSADDFLKLTKSERPSTSGEDAQKKKKKKHRIEREGSPSPLKKITFNKRASIESDSDESLQNGDAVQMRPLTGKRSRSSSADSLRAAKALSVEKPKVIASDRADGSSVTKSSSLSSHKAYHDKQHDINTFKKPKKEKLHDSSAQESERKKSINGVHKHKDAKKRKHEDGGTDPERKKKPKLHNETEVQSSRTEKSTDSSDFGKTPKSALTEKNPQKSGDQFMAALQQKAERKKEKIHRQKPPALPASSANEVSSKNEPGRKHSVDVAKPAVCPSPADTHRSAGIALAAPKAPAATPVEKQKKPAEPTRPQQAVCPFSIDSIHFDERPGTTAQRASPTSTGRRPSQVNVPTRVARKVHVFFPDEGGVKQAVATLTSTREFDFEKGLEYVRRVAESEEYAEGNQGGEYIPVVFARCRAAGDPICLVPRLIEEEETKLGTDWPKVAPLRPRSLSLMRHDHYTEYRKKFVEKPTTAPKASTIEEFRQFSVDANGNLLWNRLKRAVTKCDLVAVKKTVKTLYLPRRLPLSREGAFSRCLVQWASGDGRQVIAEMFTTAAASPMLCASDHQRCSFLRKLWQSILPHERTNFLRALEDSTDEPLSLRCVNSSAKCQLDLAIEIGVSLERTSAAGESALSYLLKNSLMDVVTSLLERGLDCRAALEPCAELRDPSKWPNEWASIRESIQRYQQLLRVSFAKWTIQPDVGFGSIGCYPVEPVSFVRVSRMPAFGGATETFKIKMSYKDAYVRHPNTAQKVLAIYSVKLNRANSVRANTTDPRRVIGTPTVHAMQCPQGETFLHISAVQIMGNSADDTGEPAKELSLVSAHKGRLWIYAIPHEALDGKEEVTVSTTLHTRATHEPGVILFSQIWDATVLGPSHPVFETI